MERVLPAPCNITAPFGSYSLEIVREKGLLTIRQRTCMHAGTYSRELFGEYHDFITSRAKLFNANIVLRIRQAE